MNGAVRERGAFRLPARVIDVLFTGIVCVLILGGMVSYEQLTPFYYRYNLLPASLIFDAFMVVYVLALPARRINRVALFFVTGSALYLVYSYISLPVPVGGAPNAMDFIIAYKPFIYLVIIGFSRPRTLSISLNTLEQVFKLLLIAVLVKYVVSKFVYGIPRPGLFVENNFEISLFLVVFIYLSRLGRLQTITWAGLLIAIVLLSGSLSGLLALLAALATSAQRSSIRLLVVATAIPVLVLMLVVMLNTRLSELADLASMDRFIFMQLFLTELHGFEWYDYLVGWDTMNPLTTTTCDALSFYRPLFSSANSNICYPVILHVFYFRMLLDHGVIGLAFLSLGFYTILINSGCSRSLAAAIMLQGVINGLSVSGLANTYFALAIVLITSSLSEAQGPFYLKSAINRK